MEIQPYLIPLAIGKKEKLNILNYCKEAISYAKDLNIKTNLKTIIEQITNSKSDSNIIDLRTYYGILTPSSCFNGWNTAVIRTDGNVNFCCKADNQICGNIKTDSFSQVWFSDKFSDFRLKWKNLLPNRYPARKCNICIFKELET